MGAELREQSRAFFLAQARDTRGMGLVYEQALSSGHRVRAHDRYVDVGDASQLLLAQRMLLHHARAAGLLVLLSLDVLGAIVAVTVHVSQALQAPLLVIRKRFISRRSAGE